MYIISEIKYAFQANALCWCSKLLNIGEPCLECQYCKAQLWYEERAEKSNTSKEVQFSLCYQKGKVQIPLLKKPPNLLEGLLNGVDHRSKLFLQNIRLYNSMFSFTSISGKIDASMNNGSAPPQFILNG